MADAQNDDHVGADAYSEMNSHVNALDEGFLKLTRSYKDSFSS